jgi:pyruvate, orthophosphate dikinase
VEATGNKKWVFDCYRRLIQMYQNVVLGKSTEPYEEVIKNTKAAKGYKHDMELSGEDWEAVVAEFKVLSDGGLPSDPHEQLETAIAAVFNSWFTPRAVRYREYNNIEGLLGTACNVQTMV